MAARRMINKTDHENPEFQQLTIRQRYMFDCIQLYADKEGRMYTKMIHSKIFPFDEDFDYMTDLKALEEIGFIEIYGDGKYIQVTSWRSTLKEWGRQQIKDDREDKSIIPANKKS